MFIFTVNGANKEIRSAIDRLDALEPRLDKLRSIARESKMLGLPDDGSGQIIAQIERGSAQMNDDLRRAKIAILSDPTSWREVLPLLKICREELATVEKTLNDIDRAIRRAEIQVKQDLGRS